MVRDRPWERIGLSGANLPRACTVVLVLALVVTITGWALDFTARRTPSEPVRPVTVGNPAARTQAADIAPIAFLFGALPGADGSNIKLVGVIAQGKRGQGIALLAVDGRPALALRAGAEIERSGLHRRTCHPSYSPVTRGTAKCGYTPRIMFPRFHKSKKLRRSVGAK